MKMLSQSGKNETGSDSVYRMSCPAEFSLLWLAKMSQIENVYNIF